MSQPPEIQFKIDGFKVERNGNYVVATLAGQRLGKPSKRFTIHGRGLKIDSVKIISTQRNKMIEHIVKRVNYLPKVDQTRIHTESLLYPGRYELEVTVSAHQPGVETKVEKLSTAFF